MMVWFFTEGIFRHGANRARVFIRNYPFDYLTALAMGYFLGF